jgi:hypothetical protein
MNKKNILLSGIGLEIYYENLGDTNEWTYPEALYQLKFLEGGGWRFPTVDEMKYIDNLSDLEVVYLYFGQYWCGQKDDGTYLYYSLEEFGKNYSASVFDPNIDRMVRPVRNIQ